MAHKGTDTGRPENSLESFAWAVDQGATWIETDLRVSADRHLVCIHDATLDRTTSATGPVAGRSLSELQALGVPSLAEAVEAFPTVCWNVDIKDHSTAVVQLMARFLEERHADDRFRVASFSGRIIRAFRRFTSHRIRTVAGGDEVALAWLASRFGRLIGRPRFDTFQIPVRAGPVVLTDGRMVRAAHRAGVAVHVWTIDDPDEAQRLVRLGVDGLITNRVDLLRVRLTPPG